MRGGGVGPGRRQRAELMPIKAHELRPTLALTR